MKRLIQQLLAGFLVLIVALPVVMGFVPWTAGPGFLRKWDLATYLDGATPYWVNPVIPQGFTPFEATDSKD